MAAENVASPGFESRRPTPSDRHGRRRTRSDHVRPALHFNSGEVNTHRANLPAPEAGEQSWNVGICR